MLTKENTVVRKILFKLFGKKRFDQTMLYDDDDNSRNNQQGLNLCLIYGGSSNSTDSQFRVDFLNSANPHYDENKTYEMRDSRNKFARVPIYRGGRVINFLHFILKLCGTVLQVRICRKRNSVYRAGH